MWNKVEWYLRQLLPLTYRTTYQTEGKKYFVVWKMWFGRSYNVDSFEVK
jgi:hypothetical protein